MVAVRQRQPRRKTPHRGEAHSLVTKGWLIARSSPQSEIIYSLNEDRLAEIVTFLKT
jgi:hypothetical protein